MTYEESDENWAKGKPGSQEGAESKRAKDLSKMRERMGNGQSTHRDEELFNKWAGDVDAGNASPGSTDFVNAMKNEGGWGKQGGEEGAWKPPEEPLPAPPECERDCLGMCNGPNTKDEHGGCCKDSQRDCAGKCYGYSIIVKQGNATMCCDRTDADSRAYCCKNPIDGCNPACPEPGQIKNGHPFNNTGCWCTPGTEHCCPANQLDSSNRCPGNPEYRVWAFEVSGELCQCNEVRATSLSNGSQAFTSKESCQAACPSNTTPVG